LENPFHPVSQNTQILMVELLDLNIGGFFVFFIAQLGWNYCGSRYSDI